MISVSSRAALDGIQPGSVIAVEKSKKSVAAVSSVPIIVQNGCPFHLSRGRYVYTRVTSWKPVKKSSVRRAL